MPHEVVYLTRPLCIFSVHIAAVLLKGNSMVKSGLELENTTYTLEVSDLSYILDSKRPAKALRKSNELQITEDCVYWPYPLYVQERSVVPLQSGDYSKCIDRSVCLLSRARVLADLDAFSPPYNYARIILPGHTQATISDLPEVVSYSELVNL